MKNQELKLNLWLFYVCTSHRRKKAIETEKKQTKKTSCMNFLTTNKNTENTEQFPVPMFAKRQNRPLTNTKHNLRTPNTYVLPIRSALFGARSRS